MAYGGTYGSATEPGSEQRRCFVSAMRETLAVANAEGVGLLSAGDSKVRCTWLSHYSAYICFLFQRVRGAYAG